jgi:hypothetical protein
MEYEDRITDDKDHTEEAKDAPTDVKHKPKWRSLIHRSMRKVLPSVRKVETGAGKAAAEGAEMESEDRITDDKDHTEEAKDASADVKHKPSARKEIGRAHV